MPWVDAGRHGHSNGIFPEMLRIPLIIHLPVNMRSRFVHDSAGLAFASDIPATLSYLLGWRPIHNSALLGRPLLTESLAEQLPYRRKNYLVESDSGPIFGILSGEGEMLYIFDAVKHEEYLFNLKTDPTASTNILTEQERESYRSQLLYRTDPRLRHGKNGSGGDLWFAEKNLCRKDVPRLKLANNIRENTPQLGQHRPRVLIDKESTILA